MSAPQYSAQDFLGALQALMPRGRVWPRESDATQTAMLDSLVQIYERSTARANDLLEDAFPSDTTELLPEWEETLGLPSPCTGVLPTLQARRTAVVAALTNTGGQSVPYFIEQADKLGYTVTITNYSPFRVGQNHSGQPLGNADWAYAWAINAPLNTVIPFRVGQSSAGEPLNSWGNTLLMCVLSSIKPAHSSLQFLYS